MNLFRVVESMSKERPIIFSAPMVQAILDGRKTQTRRAVTLPHANPLGAWEPMTIGGPNGGRTKAGDIIPDQGAIWHTRTGECLASPYGQPGDRLWVREAFHTSPHFTCLYRADYDDDARPAKVVASGGWKPSIHMPRRLSRIDLEITGIRVERLQDISREDAIAEGIEPTHIDWLGRQQWRVYPHQDGTPGEEVATYVGRPTTSRPIDSYKSLSLSINGPGSWDRNPFVWVIEFRSLADGR